MSIMFKRIRISGLKGTAIVNAMIDSGAETSVIDEKLAKKIGLVKEKLVQCETVNGSTFTGYSSSMLVRQELGNVSVNVVIVKNLKEKLILGADFLQEKNVILDFKKEIFQIKRPLKYKSKRLRL